MEIRRHAGCVAVGSQANPFTRHFGRQDAKCILSGWDFDAARRCPFAPAIAGLDSECDCLPLAVPEVQHALVVTCQEVRHGWLARRDVVGDPGSARSGRQSGLAELVPRREPQVRVRPSHEAVEPVETPGRREAAGGGVIAGEDDSPPPRREVSRDLQIVAHRSQSRSIPGREGFRKVEPPPVHVHQHPGGLTAGGFDDLSDSWPFRVPAVLAIV